MSKKLIEKTLLAGTDYRLDAQEFWDAFAIKAGKQSRRLNWLLVWCAVFMPKSPAPPVIQLINKWAKKYTITSSLNRFSG